MDDASFAEVPRSDQPAATLPHQEMALAGTVFVQDLRAVLGSDNEKLQALLALHLPSQTALCFMQLGHPGTNHDLEGRLGSFASVYGIPSYWSQSLYGQGDMSNMGQEHCTFRDFLFISMDSPV